MTGPLPDWLVLATSIAIIIIALALVVAAIILVIAALQGRRLVRSLSALVGRLHENMEALGEVRSRIERAARGTERKILDFNAFIGVVQEEAEQLFIEGAATARGIKTSARKLRELDSDASGGPEPPTTRDLPPGRYAQDDRAENGNFQGG